MEIAERRTRTDWRRWCGNWWMRTMPTGADSAGDGQLEHPSRGIPVRGLRPAEALRNAQWLEIYCTPKHGNWLNMAEMEPGGLARQCLDRRIPSRDGYPAGKSWNRKQGHGRTGGIDRGFGWISASQPSTPASSSSPSTYQYNSDWILDGSPMTGTDLKLIITALVVPQRLKK